MRRLNIAIFTDTFIPQRDGIVTTTIDLAKGLAKKGHQVYIIAPKYRTREEFSYPNITVKRLRGVPALFYPGFKFTLPFSVGLIKYIKKKNIDIIHFQTPFTIGMQAVLTAKILKIPLIGTFHTFITDKEYIKHLRINPNIIQRLSWAYVRKFYKSCQIITCPSQSTKEELIKHRFVKQIKVVSNGVDFSAFDNSDFKKIKSKYNLGKNTLLFIGRIAYEKNIDYLLECFKLVLKKIHNTKLLIVGGGPQMNQMKENIKNLGLANNIIIVGRVEHKKLLTSGIFKASSLFVTASNTETQGITTLEAQANGMVCVGIDAKGTKDLIKNGYNGYLAKEGNKEEFAQKVLTLLKNKKLRGQMIKNTLIEIKKHDIKNIINLWEDIYQEAINERK